MNLFDALANAASKAFARIADEAISQGVTEIVKLLFGGLGGTAGTAIASGVGQVGIGNLYDKGGYTGPGGKYQPAGVVHRGEYVFDKAAVDKIGVRNLEMIRAASKRGYASGGPVGDPGGFTIPKLPAPARAGVTVSMTMANDFRGADPGSEARIMAQLDRLRSEVPRTAILAVKDAQSRRVL